MAAKAETLLPAWAKENARVTELIEKHRAIAPALHEFGIEQFQGGHNAAAIKAFKAAVKLDPAQAIYLNNLGVALNAGGQADEAIAVFCNSLEVDQDQPQIWLNLAYTVKTLGRLDEAEQSLAQAAEHPATAAEAFGALSVLETERGNHAKSAEWLRRALKHDAGNAVMHASLGAALFQAGLPEEAAAEYVLAANLKPGEKGFRDNADFLTMLSGVLAGNAEAAITAYAAPLGEDDVLRSALDRAMLYLTSFGKTEAAKALATEWIQYYPDDEDALYFRQILSGRVLTRAPASYIAAHFDRLSHALGEQALKAMGYHVPEQMATLLNDAAGKTWKGDILDAGCGTGATAVALKKFAKRLAGVDLSPRMAALAKATGLYNDVVTADFLPVMETAQGEYDLIAAADSLIYFGALEPVFVVAHAALRAGGWFMFSVETNDGKDPYTLMSNGRFAHAKSYVTALGTQDFTLVSDTDMTLRVQAGKPVKGTVFLFRRA